MSKINLRKAIPLLGCLALAALFIKLPEIPNPLGLFECKACVSADPYLPLIGAGYFAWLLAVALLFPAFPSRQMAKSGFIWALTLAVILTYLRWPGWCLACLICHVCHVLMWSIWLITSKSEKKSIVNHRERVFLSLLAPIGVVALFSCLNLTFMAYGFKLNESGTTTHLKAGTTLVDFANLIEEIGNSENYVFLFVTPHCPYCKEQLPILNKVSTASNEYAFISITPILADELLTLAPNIRWIEDKDGTWETLFEVAGYPTLFIVDKDGKVEQVVPGLTKESELIALL